MDLRFDGEVGSTSSTDVSSSSPSSSPSSSVSSSLGSELWEANEASVGGMVDVVATDAEAVRTVGSVGRRVRVLRRGCSSLVSSSWVSSSSRSVVTLSGEEVDAPLICAVEEEVTELLASPADRGRAGSEG